MKSNMLGQQKTIYFIICILCFFLLGKVTLLIADNSMTSREIKELKSSPQRLVRGNAVYQYYCSPCHGRRGDANGVNAMYISPRPRNFRDKYFIKSKTDEEFRQIIYGLDRQALGISLFMPPWGGVLSDEESYSLIVYIKSIPDQEYGDDPEALRMLQEIPLSIP